MPSQSEVKKPKSQKKRQSVGLRDRGRASVVPPSGRPVGKQKPVKRHRGLSNIQASRAGRGRLET